MKTLLALAFIAYLYLSNKTNPVLLYGIAIGYFLHKTISLF